MFPQAGAEAAEDTVARETWGTSLRDGGQRGRVRAPSHAARAGTQVRKCLNGSPRRTHISIEASSCSAWNRLGMGWGWGWGAEREG